MTSVFIDTWGWINLFNVKEDHYQDVSKLYKELRNSRATIVTTDYILDEVFTLLFKRVPAEIAQKAIETISAAIKRKYLTLTWITPERFDVSLNLRLKYKDKPKISFTDLTSMAVMQEFCISHILTGDAHFTHVGMGFVLVPSNRT